MASIETEGLPLAAPAAEPWPRNELGDDSVLGLQADEMFARQLDTRFAGEVRCLVTDPVTGLAGRDPEGALAGIAATAERPLSGVGAGPAPGGHRRIADQQRLYHAGAASAGSLRRCRRRPPEWRPTEHSTKPRFCMR